MDSLLELVLVIECVIFGIQHLDKSSMSLPPSTCLVVYFWFRYKLPGHNGTVNELAFHPREAIIASCGSDGKIFLGEIEKSIL